MIRASARSGPMSRQVWTTTRSLPPTSQPSVIHRSSELPVLLVVQRERTAILEYRSGTFETDLVLGLVDSSLARIPLELDVKPIPRHEFHRPRKRSMALDFTGSPALRIPAIQTRRTPIHQDDRVRAALAAHRRARRKRGRSTFRSDSLRADFGAGAGEVGRKGTGSGVAGLTLGYWRYDFFLRAPRRPRAFRRSARVVRATSPDRASGRSIFMCCSITAPSSATMLGM